MGKFSIRRHKRGLSDSATIITVEPSMSPSQRSLYGSIISNRPRNRLQKSQHSPPSPQDENNDAPTDATKRPQRRLLRRFRLPHHHRTGSLEEKKTTIPPEQKPHFNSLPTSPNRSLGLRGRRYASRNWSDNDIRPPSSSRVPYATPRGSVGSSADILLTPIRGSTAISDEDFVFLTSDGREEFVHSWGEGAGSPEPTTQALFAGPDSEIRSHPVLLEPIVIEPTYTPHEPLPLEYKPSPPPTLEILPHSTPEPEPEHEAEEPLTPMSSSSETRTITNTIVEINQNPPGVTSMVLLAAEAEEVVKEPSLQAIHVVEPTLPPREPKVSFQEPTSSPTSTKSEVSTTPLTIDTELPSQRNIIPFPSDLESARTPIVQQWPDSTAIAEPVQPHTTRVAWATSVYQTAEGIMLLALDCYRWLLRKGFRNDLRSCMSYWFLKELVIGFILPLCLTPIALWFFFRTVHEYGLGSALF